MKHPMPDPDRDGDLLVRYRDGDAQAFRSLVDLYQNRLLQFFYRLCWDRDRAEDLTQELFIKLIQASRRYRPEGKLSTFVYRVATNLWIDHYRAARPHARLLSLDQVVLGGRADLTGREQNPAQHAVEDEEKQVLRQALESLTEPHRLVFELAVYQERPYAEISELLKIPLGTVKSRMHNAVHALKHLLGQPVEHKEEPADNGGTFSASSGPATIRPATIREVS